MAHQTNQTNLTHISALPDTPQLKTPPTELKSNPEKLFMSSDYFLIQDLKAFLSYTGEDQEDSAERRSNPSERVRSIRKTAPTVHPAVVATTTWAAATMTPPWRPIWRRPPAAGITITTVSR